MKKNWKMGNKKATTIIKLGNPHLAVQPIGGWCQMPQKYIKLCNWE